MKMKFKISNRILSLVLILVMVASMLPMMSMTANPTQFGSTGILYPTAYSSAIIPEIPRLP